MIVKNFEIDKLKNLSQNIFLFYGENQGYKDQIINKYFIKNFKNNIDRFEENEIFNNYDTFFSGLMNKSFFEENKIIIISRTTEKILKLVEDFLEKKIKDIILIINTGALDKKSKLRNFFEKEKKVVCLPIYSDDNKILNSLANNFFKKNNIQISQETINLIVERCQGDRLNLDNELEKISIFINGKSKIDNEEIIKLTNLAENYSISELADNCLSNNKKKTIKILNENNFSQDDCIIIVRTLLLKSKRILKLSKNYEINHNIDETINSYKPPIFWKDKEIVKSQVITWKSYDAEKLIFKISDLELDIKKNSNNSLNILSDFILNTANHTSN